LPIRLGAIADDFTGATDLAALIRRSGMSVSLFVDTPVLASVPPVDAIVIALKTRTVPPEDAVRASVEAARWLRHQAGAEHLFFKYCSTFDSTDRGNIGPVIDALLRETGAGKTIAVPAFPENGRRMFAGHLFVGDRLLSESSMANHPLTPMHDSDIVRVLGRQRNGPVRLIDKTVIDAGMEAIRERFGLATENTVLVCDAIGDGDLERLAEAFADLPFSTGGSAIGAMLARQWHDDVAAGATAFEWPAPGAATVLALSGSVSEATRRQVAHAIDQGWFGIRVTADEALDQAVLIARVLASIEAHRDQPCLIYATDTPAAVLDTQARLGREQAGEALESFFGSLAVAVRSRGYNGLIVAGGETSGAVVKSLALNEMTVGPEIAAGVPWVRAGGLWLALKSGNFGRDSFFEDARRMLADQETRHEH
jgi:uncharacterized protein YgbK (DUF1537 family)